MSHSLMGSEKQGRDGDAIIPINDLRHIYKSEDGNRSAESLNSIIDAEGIIGPTPEQFMERIPALEYLKAPKNERGDYGYDNEEQERILLRLADRAYDDKKIVLQRFGRLANYCLLRYQHELVQIDKKIVGSNGNIDSPNELKRIRLLLLEYCKFRRKGG